MVRCGGAGDSKERSGFLFWDRCARPRGQHWGKCRIQRRAAAMSWPRVRERDLCPCDVHSCRHRRGRRPTAQLTDKIPMSASARGPRSPAQRRRSGVGIGVGVFGVVGRRIVNRRTALAPLSSSPASHRPARRKREEKGEGNNRATVTNSTGGDYERNLEPSASRAGPTIQSRLGEDPGVLWTTARHWPITVAALHGRRQGPESYHWPVPR